MAVGLPEDSDPLPYVRDIEEAYQRALSPTFVNAVSQADFDAIFDQIVEVSVLVLLALALVAAYAVRVGIERFIVK